MSRCTWKGCESEGVESQKDRDGNEWALLCAAHHAELEAAIDLGLKDAKAGAPKLLRAWILASGGNPIRGEERGE